MLMVKYQLSPNCTSDASTEEFFLQNFEQDKCERFRARQQNYKFASSKEIK